MSGDGRRHHNNSGMRQIRRGRTREQVRRIARRLGIPYGANIERVNEQERILNRSQVTLACGCILISKFVANELPDRNGTVYPFMVQVLGESLCVLHKLSGVPVGCVSFVTKPRGE